MKLHTASEIISLAKKLEEESASFYKHLANRYSEDKDALLSFAEENAKNVVQIERAYYGVITDAIEGCFAFDLEAEDYALETNSALNARGAGALDEALKIEEKIIRFYSDAAEQSQSLMADVPIVFRLIARKRGNRVEKLKLLLNRGG